MNQLNSFGLSVVNGFGFGIGAILAAELLRHVLGFHF